MFFDGNLHPSFPDFGLSGELASVLQGEGECGIAGDKLSKERGYGEGVNGSREGGSSGCWGFIASGWSRFRVHSSETIGWSRRCAGDASWSKSSDASVELDRLLCQRVRARVQIACKVFMPRPGCV
jgi:hypothetical protein